MRFSFLFQLTLSGSVHYKAAEISCIKNTNGKFHAWSCGKYGGLYPIFIDFGPFFLIKDFIPPDKGRCDQRIKDGFGFDHDFLGAQAMWGTSNSLILERGDQER